MSWLNKDFRYVPLAEQGDGYLKRKFARIRAELKAKAEQEQRNQAEAQSKTITLKTRAA